MLPLPPADSNTMGLVHFKESSDVVSETVGWGTFLKRGMVGRKVMSRFGAFAYICIALNSPSRFHNTEGCYLSNDLHGVSQMAFLLHAVANVTTTRYPFALSPTSINTARDIFRELLPEDLPTIGLLTCITRLINHACAASSVARPRDMPRDFEIPGVPYSQGRSVRAFDLVARRNVKR